MSEEVKVLYMLFLYFGYTIETLLKRIYDEKVSGHLTITENMVCECSNGELKGIIKEQAI